jgi:hypothetical protein
MQLSLGRAIGLIGQAYGEDQTLIENCDRHEAPMTLSSPDTPPEDVPEADWAEQTLDADPLAEAEAERQTKPVSVGRGIREVDEADLAEQETVVYGEDEDLR